MSISKSQKAYLLTGRAFDYLEVSNTTNGDFNVKNFRPNISL